MEKYFNQLNCINVLPPRCDYHLPRLDLNGVWKIKAYQSFYDLEENFLDSQLSATIDVPSCVQYYGYDNFQYVNYDYPFPYNPPLVPHQNPTFHYQKTVTINKDGNKKYIVFEGVDSCFYLFVNKQFVGFSQISHRTSEFDITDLVHNGENIIDVVVLKWCASSYLESQDKWRFTGIFRDVYILSRPIGHIVDYSITTDIEGNEASVRFKLNRGKLCDVTFLNQTKQVREGQYIEFKVANPQLWSADNPYLYDIVIDAAGECIEDRVGIRKVEIDGGIFKLNGRHIKIKGVNRHDFHPKKGMAVGAEDILADILLMKKYGINAIRTSHYPSAPILYRLCDQHGIYVMSEADCETHGSIVRKGLVIADSDLFCDAIIERNECMVEREKNRPCVLFWSLGNECGFGINFEKALARIKELDQTRLTHLETICSIWDKDNYYTCGLDMTSRMYPTLQWITDDYLVDPRETRPLMLCEYSHAMGNAPGDLSQYWKIINSNDRIMGGFVWEFKEHGVLYGEGGYKYGGDFGESVHDGNFCLDGLVGASLEELPSIRNLGRVYMDFKQDKPNIKNYPKPANTSQILTEDKKTIKLSSGNITVLIDKFEGSVISILQDEIQQLTHPMRINIWRAPIDNERGTREKWHEYGFDTATPYIENVLLERDRVRLEGKMLPVSRDACMDFCLEYSMVEGGLKVALSYSVPDYVDSLPRIGLCFALDKAFDKCQYDAYGEYETYADTYHLQNKGEYTKSILEMFTNYTKPQECGSRFGADFVKIFGDNAVEVVADKPFSFSALPYSATELAAASHNWRLPKPSATNISLDIAMRGIGSSACGPELAPEFETPKSGSNTFYITLKRNK